eukprot:GHRR01032824.1.p1 GENE.GHRR01032824.1~~GHRR01032824.1.p1  ORF type:complete len:219 (+),score=44.44 GHRR01032824.1:162-818(+)
MHGCTSLSMYMLVLILQAKTSVEAVQLVADLVRKRQCSLSPRVVGCLLVLQFEQVTPTSQGGEGVGSRLVRREVAHIKEHYRLCQAYSIDYLSCVAVLIVFNCAFVVVCCTRDCCDLCRLQRGCVSGSCDLFWAVFRKHEQLQVYRLLLGGAAVVGYSLLCWLLTEHSPSSLMQGKKAACKAAKARKKPDLERDFAEAEAVPDVKELALLQSQMLEVR